MATSAIAHPLPAAATSYVHTLRIFRKETKYEFLKLVRTKSFSLSTIGFPVMFYVLFGIANRNASAGNIHIAKYMLGGYACFGLIGAALSASVSASPGNSPPAGSSSSAPAQCPLPPTSSQSAQPPSPSVSSSSAFSPQSPCPSVASP